MIRRVPFQTVWFLGLSIGTVSVLYLGIVRSIDYQGVLVGAALLHMFLLVLLSLKVEAQFKSASGTYVQYAGYIWTLIGVVSILASFQGKSADANLLRIFLWGAGLAVGTSIIGWTAGKLLEDRDQVQTMDSAAAAADDLARTLTRIRDSLDSAGKTLAAGITGSVTNVYKMNKETQKAAELLEDLSEKLKVSATNLIGAIDNAKVQFGGIGTEIEGLESTITTGLKKVKDGVEELATLSEHAKSTVDNLDALATSVKNSAKVTEDLVGKSVQVIDQTGRFIDKVFGDGKAGVK